MIAILQAYNEILFQRRGPEDLPDSAFLLRWTLVLNALVSLINMWISGVDLVVGAMRYLALIVVMIFLVKTALSSLDLGARLTRTLTAIFGADSMLTVVQWSISWWWFTTVTSVPDGSEIQPHSALILAQILILIWWFSVISFVIQRATERPRVLGLCVAGVHFMVTLLLEVAFPLAR